MTLAFILSTNSIMLRFYRLFIVVSGGGWFDFVAAFLPKCAGSPVDIQIFSRQQVSPIVFTLQ
jgi:hypothetical protein